MIDLTRSELQIARWAESAIGDFASELVVSHAERPHQMAHTLGATGIELASNGHIGADVIRIAAGRGFVPHTHPGHHVLVVVGGEGTITYAGQVYKTQAGDAYLIEGMVPHAVGAISDHVIVAVGAPHMPVDSTARMAPVPYEEVTADDGDLSCRICELGAVMPERLHTVGCTHCPCSVCMG
jgi:quercetin dioxygenase-like cupin family protein